MTRSTVQYYYRDSGARYRRTMATREQEHDEQSAPTDALSGTPLGEEGGAPAPTPAFPEVSLFIPTTALTTTHNPPPAARHLPPPALTTPAHRH